LVSSAQAIKSKKARIVTDSIIGDALLSLLLACSSFNRFYFLFTCFRNPDILLQDFTAHSVVLESGQSIRADAIVTATG
jgi:hypothetical protein